MEEREPSAPEQVGRLEEGGRDPHVVPVGNIRELLTEAGPGNIKQELPQPWETQWQELLKTVEDPRSGGPMPQSEEDTKEFQSSLQRVAAASHGPLGEGMTPTLPDLLSEEAQDSLVSCVKVKEEILGEEDVIGLETQPPHLRQLCDQESKGAQEV